MLYFLIFAILLTQITQVGLSFTKYVIYFQNQIDKYTIQNPVNEGLRFASILFLIGYPIFFVFNFKELAYRIKSDKSDISFYKFTFYWTCNKKVDN